MLQRLILLNGNKGSGRQTIGELLYRSLDNAAWTHDSWLCCCRSSTVSPDKKTSLFHKYLPSLIRSYLELEIETIIVSGGVTNQNDIDLITLHLPHNLVYHYIWLDTPKAERSQRLVSRSRDSSDSVESVSQILSKETDSAPILTIPANQYVIIDSNQEPNKVVAQIKNI